ncbi:hypothetical protein SODALDRAFT_320442 [Sodiomyces alkalinus F11]|uniref:Uncharacterized protein n=1 Tax=Sodiomyces alkalinus (strain CBS 110278 / VKM F-3762 / F11) TaxID=1314773 RepID=A0A3N2PNB0_SODAK|nr:hypothetical protein SODALDRAFT_320442 [Sodiomyces alkalinus F11]ROT35973.1 hypothetical protein SODALDRAFT_320442 [Sodiomyces alkalinus F11]
MPSIHRLFSRSDYAEAVGRDEDKSISGEDNVLDYMIILLGLLFLALLCGSVLFLLRRHRHKQQIRQNEGLPSYNEVKGNRNHNNLTIETTQNGRSSILVISRDGQPMLANPNSPPASPDNVPEIRITFPDEHDEKGERKSGRVVVVRVGDGGVVGLEPVREEQLPAYEKENKSDFYSIDMDQIGGLKEKEYR